MKSCPCGRSPTGSCIGWHALSEDDYKKALTEYENKQRSTNQGEKNA